MFDQVYAQHDKAAVLACDLSGILQRPSTQTAQTHLLAPSEKGIPEHPLASATLTFDQASAMASFILAGWGRLNEHCTEFGQKTSLNEMQ